MKNKIKEWLDEPIIILAIPPVGLIIYLIIDNPAGIFHLFGNIYFLIYLVITIVLIKKAWE